MNTEAKKKSQSALLARQQIQDAFRALEGPEEHLEVFRSLGSEIRKRALEEDSYSRKIKKVSQEELYQIIPSAPVAIYVWDRNNFDRCPESIRPRPIKLQVSEAVAFMRRPDILVLAPPIGVTEKPSASGPEQLERLTEEVDRVQMQLRARISEILTALSGQDFETLEAKQEIVAKINRLLSAAGTPKLVCPTCDEPGLLRAEAVTKNVGGLFRFRHTTGKKGNHSSVRFPDTRIWVPPEE